MRRLISIVVVLCGVAGLWFWTHARRGQDADGAKSSDSTRGAPEPESAQASRTESVQPQPAKSATPLPSRPTVRPKASYEAIWQRLDTNVSKPKPTQPAKLVAKPDPPVALPTNLRLKGTIVEDDGAYAVLEDLAGKQHLLEQGDSIQGILIEAVHDDHVELAVGGKTVELNPISDREQSKSKARLPRPGKPTGPR